MPQLQDPRQTRPRRVFLCSNCPTFRNHSKARSCFNRRTCSIDAGRATVLIGPSGCGKSTLLRLMVGLIQPDSGTVSFEGTPITPSDALALRRRMGFVLQDGGLFPHLSARDNVTLLARFLRWDRAKLDVRVAELASLVRLPTELLDRYPAQLSGGQRQRLGIMLRSFSIRP